MRYIIVELQTNADGSVTFPSDPRQKVYNDLNTAESEFHRILQYAAISTSPYKGCMLLTNYGEVLRAEFYEHPDPEPDPEPEDDTPTGDEEIHTEE